jgi:hypothetical protein
MTANTLHHTLECQRGSNVEHCLLAPLAAEHCLLAPLAAYSET